ncbi:PKD domain-containing protein [Paenibacillus sp. GYB003]|uniref:PKD domain-containing protein n=1 Tax=Paenibacillus sp. GYB003 TaxID=2994392 RepID=UPI002F9657FA
MKKYLNLFMIALILTLPFIHPYDGVFAAGTDPTSFKVKDIVPPSVAFNSSTGKYYLSSDVSFDGGTVDLSGYEGIQKVELIDLKSNTVIRQLSPSSGTSYSVGVVQSTESMDAHTVSPLSVPYGYFEWFRDPNKVVWMYDLDGSRTHRSTRPNIFDAGPPSSCYNAVGPFPSDVREYLDGTCAQGTFMREGTLEGSGLMSVSSGETFNLSDLKNVTFDSNEVRITSIGSLSTHLGMDTFTLDPKTLNFKFKVKMDFSVGADDKGDDIPGLGKINRWGNQWEIGLKATVYKYPYMEVRVTTGPTGNEPDLGGIIANGPICTEAGTAGAYTFYFSNNGKQSITTPFKAQVKVGPSVIFEETYSSLNSGGSKTINFNYTPPSAGNVTFNVSLDPDGALLSGKDKEVLRGNNTKSFTYEAKAAGGCGAAGGGIDGDFDIIPNTINYRDPFDIVPKNITVTIPGCTYTKHEFQFSRAGKVDRSPDVNGKTRTLTMTYEMYKYLPAIAVGTVDVSLKIHTTCGETGWIKTKPLTVVNSGNLPPTLEIKWFKRGDRSTPVTQVIQGQPVDLVLVDTNDPDGDTVTWNWDFAGSSSSWIRSLPSKYGFGTKELDYNNISTADVTGSHSIWAYASDGMGGTGSASATLNVLAPAPIPVIKGPSQVVQNRPLPQPFDSSASYSPVGRSIDHSKDEWGNKRATYPTPGDEIITLWVTDSAGLRSEGFASHTLKVIPDKPPIAVLNVPPFGLRNQTFDIFNNSYSEDGDTIVSAEYKYKYDSNNNGFADDPWQTLSGDLTKTELRPTKVGKYLFYTKVCEDWGACGDTSAQAYVGLTLDVTNLAPEVSFDISGKNEQPPLNPSIPFSPSTILGWPLYETNTNNQVTNKNYMWAAADGKLKAGLGKGLEFYYPNTKSKSYPGAPSDMYPIFNPFSDGGFGPNGISPYKGILPGTRDASRGQPLLLPPKVGGKYVVKTPIDPTTPLTPIEFMNQNTPIQSTKTHIYFWGGGDANYNIKGTLFAYNKSRIPKYRSATKMVGDGWSYTATLEHYWDDGVNPYDLAFPENGGTAIDLAFPKKAILYKGGGYYDGWRNESPSITKFGTQLAGDKILVPYMARYSTECTWSDGSDGDGSYWCSYEDPIYAIAQFDALNGSLIDDGRSHPIPSVKVKGPNPWLDQIYIGNVPANVIMSTSYLTIRTRGNNLLFLSSGYSSGDYYLELTPAGDVVTSGMFSQPSIPLYGFKKTYKNNINGQWVTDNTARDYDCRWVGPVGNPFAGGVYDDEGNPIVYRQVKCFYPNGPSNGEIFDHEHNPNQPSGLYVVKFDLATGQVIVSAKLGGQQSNYSQLGPWDQPEENDALMAYNPFTMTVYTRSFSVYYCNGCTSGELTTYYEAVSLDGSGAKWGGPQLSYMFRNWQSPFYMTPTGATGSGWCAYTASGTCERYDWHNDKFISERSQGGGGGGSYSATKTRSFIYGQFVGDGIYLSMYGGHDQSGCSGCSAQGYSTSDRFVFLDVGAVNTSGSTGFRLGQFVSPGTYDNSEINFTLNLGQAKADNEFAGISFRMQDPTNRYAVEVDGSNLYISKYVSGVRSVLKSIGFSMQDRVDYGFKLIASGSTIKLSVNGVPYFDFTDETYTSGKFGPFSNKSYASFGSISIKGVLPNRVEWLTDYAIYNEGFAEVKYDNVKFADPENDPMAGTYKWSIAHTPKFLNNQGYSTLNGKTFSSAQVNFDAVGIYDVTLRAKDDPHPNYLTPSNVFDAYRKDSNAYSKRITVHRRPISLFSLVQGSDGRFVWDYQDYDPDRWQNAWTYSGPETPGMNYATDRGIKDRKHYYITPSGVLHEGKLVSPQEVGNYIVGLQSIDEWGAESIPYEVSYWVNVKGPANTPPTATMRVPDGTSSAPTIVTTVTPYFEWNQNDVDPGTLFSAFQLQILNEWSGLIFDSYSLGQGPTPATVQGWTVTSALPAGQKLQVRVRVYDGTDWSEWSPTTWFFINRPPTAVMLVPGGTESNPTKFNDPQPTFQWSQTDLDPGTVFTYFQLQVTNEANTWVIHDSGQYWQGTSSTIGSYRPPVEMPKGQKLRVWVRVFDGYEWSSFSPQTWFYINQAPNANFDWAPKPAWEGDTITITNLSSDPDGDILTYNWTITGPGGYSRSANSQHTSILGSDTVKRPGAYVVSLTVTDPHGLPASVTKTIVVGELTIIGQVNHTPQWESNRKAYNLSVSGNEESPWVKSRFLAGEKFILNASTTDTLGSTTVANQVTATLLQTGDRSVLSSSNRIYWSGEMWKETFDQLSDGAYRFRFEARYTNGVVKTTEVPITIDKTIHDYFDLVRVK